MLTLVVLGLENSVGDKTTDKLMETIVRECGTSGRTYKSALIFAVPDAAENVWEAIRKNVSVESFKVYGAHEATRGSDQVVRLPMYNLAGEKCGDFHIGLAEHLRKGKAAAGGKLGVFLPHGENGKPVMPGPDRITIVVEGSKDAAALHGPISTRWGSRHAGRSMP